MAFRILNTVILMLQDTNIVSHNGLHRKKKKKSMWQKKQLEQCQGNYTFMNDV